jgi:hypothetical protein
VAAYPSGQGATLYYLGRVLAAGGRPGEAEVVWRRGVTVVEAVVRRLPDQPEGHKLLGSLLGQLAELRRARASLWGALAPLGLAWDSTPAGRVLHGQAAVTFYRGQLAEAAGLCKEGMRHERLARRADPANLRFLAELEALSWSLARVANQLDSHADLAEAVAGLVEVSEGQGHDPPQAARDYRRAAGALARCVLLARADGSLSAAERAARVEAYGARAVQLLQKAMEKGYRDVSDLRQAPDLEPVRSRRDFQELIGNAVERRPRST